MDSERCGDCGSCPEKGDCPEALQWSRGIAEQVKDLMSRHGRPIRMHSPICDKHLASHSDCRECISFDACQMYNRASQLIHRLAGIIVLGKDPEDILMEAMTKLVGKGPGHWLDELRKMLESPATEKKDKEEGTDENL